MITAAVTFVPFYGKSMLFGRYPVAYDFHIMLGAGYAATTGTGRISTGSAFAPVVGVGARFFASEWISVDLGVRDYIVNMPLVAPAAVVNPESTFVQNFMVTIGVSFFFPPEFERTP
jgi:outer membrane beta-barrel protein